VWNMRVVRNIFNNPCIKVRTALASRYLFRNWLSLLFLYFLFREGLINMKSASQYSIRIFERKYLNRDQYGKNRCSR